MSLHEGAKTRVRGAEIKVELHQGYVLSPFLFVVVVDVVSKFAREGALSDLLHADD